jgi:hypothetical protein
MFAVLKLSSSLLLVKIKFLKKKPPRMEQKSHSHMTLGVGSPLIPQPATKIVELLDTGLEDVTHSSNMMFTLHKILCSIWENRLQFCLKQGSNISKSKVLTLQQAIMADKGINSRPLKNVHMNVRDTELAKVSDGRIQQKLVKWRAAVSKQGFKLHIIVMMIETGMNQIQF